MGASSAIDLAIEVLTALPSLVTAGEEALALMNSTTASLRAMQAENRDPTDAEWDAVHAVIATLRARLDG